MTDRELWQEYTAASGVTAPYEAWAFGGAPEKLAWLVAAGIKTATASAYPLYEADGEPLPQVGDYSVILAADEGDKAACVIRTTKVTVVPFCEVTREHAFREGEGDRSLAYWRAVHEEFFRDELKDTGMAFDETMPVVCEEFEVVWRNGTDGISLRAMSLPLMQTYYREFERDPVLFADPDEYAPYTYDPAAVEAEYARRCGIADRVDFMIMRGQTPVGEIALKHIDAAAGTAEMSVHLQNDTVKNCGYGTRAERLVLYYAFAVRELDTVTADAVHGNARSQHVLEKIGFTRTGENDLFVQYAITRAAWRPEADDWVLVPPSDAYVKTVEDYRREFLEIDGSMDGCGSLRRMEDVRDWVRFSELLTRRDTLPDADRYVPATQWMCVRPSDGAVLGMIQIRHEFNTFLRAFGGHIGYSVRPRARRQGVAGWMLKCALAYCRDALGMERVMITCLVTNEASRRTILRAGGVYEKTVHEPREDVYLERYWIDLRK